MAVALLFGTAPARAECGQAPGGGPARDEIAEALVRLRDFGATGSHPANESLMAVSPDGTRIALQIREADPVANSYCQSMLVILLDGASPELVVDRGGEFIKASFSNRRLAGFPAGVILPVSPSWSPDGEWIAYLRRDDGVTRLWRARADGGRAEAIPTAATSISDVKWLEDGTLLVTSEKALADAGAEIETEGRSGYRFDYRVWQASGAKPYPGGKYEPSYVRLDLLRNTESPVSAEEAKALLASCVRQCPEGALQVSTSENGENLAWVEREEKGRINGPLQLHARVEQRDFSCVAASCRGAILSNWWTPSGDLLFMRSEGPAQRSRLGLYRWRPGDGGPTRLVLTTDLLLGCKMARNELLCARETSARPRHIVAIDPQTGTIKPVFDPNPDFSGLELGTVERRIWEFPGGEAFGDLVLPPEGRPGAKLPLIVVQYSSRGFLRGGTGDEYPIFAFSGAGFAVLSFHRPTDVYESSRPASSAESMRINVKDWADRRRVLAALEAAIDQLVAEGIVDPERIGITGLSDGASTVQFALLNSDRFRAAAVSSCCEDMSNYASMGEEYYRDLMSWGYPARGTDGSKFWSDYSLLDNAPRVQTPLLMQLADDEFRMAVPAYFSLQAAKKSVELYVFSDEHHIKWQPAHRLAIYRRNLQWFDFWLKGAEDERIDYADQYARWRAMRELDRRR